MQLHHDACLFLISSLVQPTDLLVPRHIGPSEKQAPLRTLSTGAAPKVSGEPASISPHSPSQIQEMVAVVGYEAPSPPSLERHVIEPTTSPFPRLPGSHLGASALSPDSLVWQSLDAFMDAVVPEVTLGDPPGSLCPPLFAASLGASLL
jgi:hypothetical protein